MANYTTHFSTLFDVRTPENVDRALALYAELAREIEEEDETSLNFLADPERDQPGSEAKTTLWIHDRDYGDPGPVIAFVKRCAAAFGLDGRWASSEVTTAPSRCSMPMAEVLRSPTLPPACPRPST